MELQRIGVKLFVEDSRQLDLVELIPLFHRWIQTHALEGLWIDVADYTHVRNGPGVMLIGHEGNYAMDMMRGRMGLVHWRKQPLEGSFGQRLETIARATLHAARLLEEAPETGSRIRFRGDELLIAFNDRLNAPNRDETVAALRPELAGFLEKLFAGQPCTIERETDPRELCMLQVKSSGAFDTATLLSHLQSG